MWSGVDLIWGKTVHQHLTSYGNFNELIKYIYSTVSYIFSYSNLNELIKNIDIILYLYYYILFTQDRSYWTI